MSYLLDTCTFLWLCQEPTKVPSSMRSILEDVSNEIYLSVISVWEIALKESLGQFQFAKSLNDLVDSATHELGINLLDLNVNACSMLRKLPAIHRDPFDRMLVCQAIVGGLIIVTPDSEIAKYPVEISW